jgi:hypothetical protein
MTWGSPRFFDAESAVLASSVSSLPSIQTVDPKNGYLFERQLPKWVIVFRGPFVTLGRRDSPKGPHDDREQRFLWARRIQLLIAQAETKSLQPGVAAMLRLMVDRGLVTR